MDFIPSPPEPYFCCFVYGVFYCADLRYTLSLAGQLCSLLSRGSLEISNTLEQPRVGRSSTNKSPTKHMLAPYRITRMSWCPNETLCYAHDIGFAVRKTSSAFDISAPFQHNRRQSLDHDQLGQQLDDLKIKFDVIRWNFVAISSVRRARDIFQLAGNKLWTASMIIGGQDAHVFLVTVKMWITLRVISTECQ